jgi:hypothetical protein
MGSRARGGWSARQGAWALGSVIVPCFKGAWGFRQRAEREREREMNSVLFLFIYFLFILFLFMGDPKMGYNNKHPTP